MLINGTDVRKYGAKLLTVKITPPKMATKYEMLPKALLPVEYHTDIPLGRMDVTIYFRSKNRAELQRTLSSFMQQFRASVVLDEIRGYKGKYKAFLTEDDYTDTLEKQKKILSLSFEGYFFDDDEEVVFDGKTAGKVYSEGSRDTPCVLTITAKKELKNYSVTLNEEVYTIENTLAAGKAIEINGKTGKVTMDGKNAFDQVDLWSFPKIRSGENEVKFSSPDATVKVKFRRMWI